MWIHLPSSVSIPVVEDSTSDSEWLFPMLAQFVTWRGTLRPSKSWSRTCKREGWMKHRSGLIPEPSTASRGVEQWIGSLAASRASRSPLQERSEEPMMNAGSGPTSDASLAKWNPEDCSWRTSQASLLTGELTQFLETWPRTGMTRSGQLFALPTLVRRTEGSGALSWPTPISQEQKTGVANHQGRSLNKEVALWATPMAADDGKKVTPNSLQDGLIGQSYRFGRPGHKMPKGGDKSSQQTRRLNPRFVEMLMGWPLGWTDFVSSATELSPSKPPSPSTSSGTDRNKRCEF